MIIIGLVLLARWLDRRRLAASTPGFPPLGQSQDELLQGVIDKIVRDFAGRVKILETKVWHDTRLHVFFLVDSNTERSPEIEKIGAEIDQAFRRELLLSGYFVRGRDTVLTSVMSRETYDSPWLFR